MSTSTTTITVNCRNENELANLTTAVNELVSTLGVQGLVNLANKANHEPLIRGAMKAMTAVATLANGFSKSRPFNLTLPLPATTTPRAANQLAETLTGMLRDYGGAKGMMILHHKFTTDADLASKVTQAAAG